MSMLQYAYSLLQLRPDAEREEGLNVAVAVVQYPSTIVVRSVDPRQLAEVLRRLNVPTTRHRFFEKALQMFVKRLGRIEDCTERGLRDFASKEAGAFVLLPPHPTAPDDAKAIAARVFQMYVQPRPVGAEQGVALHDAALNLPRASPPKPVSHTTVLFAPTEPLVHNPMPQPLGASYG